MPKTLVFIGDSLTEWYDWQKRFPAYEVLNLGISGETVEQLLERRDRIRTLAKDPSTVFLMTGINNVLMERYDITLPFRELVRNLTTWYKGATIVVQSLLPIDMPWISNDLIRDINRRLKELAKEQNADYLDVYSAFVDADGNVKAGLLSDDGVHLANKGYEVWVMEVERFLRKGQV
ncbi:MAG TPA: GDSL-type esterase/lipase family protein [Nitrospirota bacterium]|nr:GDSL-type esterase/lipase family protein [Nitrospirota bacterium]